MKANTEFRAGDYCAYRTHGVGQVREIREIKVGNFSSKCIVVYFEKEKMEMSVPMSQVKNGNLRRISTMQQFDEVFKILRNGVKKVKGMWSRRAKEYEEKINSGEIFQTAEVIRDLTRDIDDADRSYSERIIYETAIYRVSSEYAIAAKISFEKAREDILEISKEKIKFVDTGAGNQTATA